MTAFKPFEDDASNLTVGEIEVENGKDRLSIHGSLDVTRDKAGLGRARRLRDVLDAAVRAMEADPALPDAVPGDVASTSVRNPFD